MEPSHQSKQYEILECLNKVTKDESCNSCDKKMTKELFKLASCISL